MKTFTVDIRKWNGYARPKNGFPRLGSGLYYNRDKSSCCLGFVVAQQLDIDRKELIDLGMPSEILTGNLFDEPLVKRINLNLYKLKWIKEKLLCKNNKDKCLISKMADVNDRAIPLNSSSLFKKNNLVTRISIKGWI